MTGAMRFFHLLGAMVWVGGLITLGALVPAMRKAGADRPIIQAVARQFARVSWAAFGVAVLTGGWVVIDYLSVPALPWKLGLVALTGGLALWHQFAARTQSAKIRGILQGVILATSLGVVAAAIAL